MLITLLIAINSKFDLQQFLSLQLIFNKKLKTQKNKNASCYTLQRCYMSQAHCEGDVD